MKVFLLEDNKDVADSLIHALEMRDTTVTWATTVAEAKSGILTARPEDFDKYVLDLQLPDGYGSDVLPMLFGLLGQEMLLSRVAIYSGLPNEAQRYAKSAGFPDVKCMGKGNPFALFDWIEGKS